MDLERLRLRKQWMRGRRGHRYRFLHREIGWGPRVISGQPKSHTTSFLLFTFSNLYFSSNFRVGQELWRKVFAGLTHDRWINRGRHLLALWILTITEPRETTLLLTPYQQPGVLWGADLEIQGEQWKKLGGIDNSCSVFQFCWLASWLLPRLAWPGDHI